MWYFATTQLHLSAEEFWQLSLPEFWAYFGSFSKIEDNSISRAQLNHLMTIFPDEK